MNQNTAIVVIGDGTPQAKGQGVGKFKYPPCSLLCISSAYVSCLYSHVVVLKTTPCGLPVAIKRNTPKECNLLRALAAAASGKLFPAYYYYSNTTYACYSEHLGPHHTRWSDLIIVRPQLPPPVLWGLKTVFLQGVTAVHKCVHEVSLCPTLPPFGLQCLCASANV